MAKQIRKKLVFDKPQSFRPNFNRESFIFPFSMVDSNLDGMPEEEYHTTKHIVKVQISETLICCWGFENSDLVKILFEYAKRHIEKRIKEGKLSEEEELTFNTRNSPNPCPFNPSRIPKPNGAIVHIEIDEEDFNQKAKFDYQRAERIFRIKDFELSKKHGEEKQSLYRNFESTEKTSQINNEEKALTQLFVKHIQERSAAYIESIIQAIEKGKLVNLETTDELVRILQQRIDTDFASRKNLLQESLASKNYPDDVKKSVVRGFSTKINHIKQYCIDKLIMEIEKLNGLVQHPDKVTTKVGREKMEWDAFISHASEDKKEVVEPLAEELKKRGLKIWFDEYNLKIGDKLLQKIDEGLTNSKYGIVIISPSFFEKEWPQMELNGLIQKEIGSKKVILPVWHNITNEKVKKYSPILAGRIAGKTNKGIQDLADKLISAMSDEIDIVGSTNSTSKKEVDIKVSFGNKFISSELHRYILIITFTLNEPPSIRGFKLKLFWPEFIKITKLNGLTLSKSLIKENRPYKEFIVELEHTLFPGECIGILTPTVPRELEYEFNNYTENKVDTNTIYLFWEAYTENRLPIKGKVDFKQLNKF